MWPLMQNINKANYNRNTNKSSWIFIAQKIKLILNKSEEMIFCY